MKERTELPFIQALITFLKPKICVEVGVAKGQAAEIICKALKQVGGAYWGYDNWEQYGLANEFKALGSQEAVSNKLINIPFNDFTIQPFDHLTNTLFIQKHTYHVSRSSLHRSTHRPYIRPFCRDGFHPSHFGDVSPWEGLWVEATTSDGHGVYDRLGR